MGTFAERLDTRHNSLNFIRLVLAALVIVSHASPIGGFGDGLHFGGLSLGTLAVGGFFAISGYLITRSGFNSSLLPYLWRRFLRIFPGYWGCLLSVGLGFSAVASLWRSGWSLEEGLNYFLSNITMVMAGDPLGGLSGAPFPETWNGSLWTLRYELLCYIAVGVALLVPQFRRVRAIIPLAFIAITTASMLVQSTGGPLIVRDIALLVPYFLAGATLFRYADRFLVSWKYAVGALAFLLVVLLSGFGPSLTPLPVAYLCMWLGVVLPTTFQRVGARNDISYGVYLYGFPVQQMLVLLGGYRLGLPAFAALGVAAVIPFAVASWFLIERPAMRLKNLPQRVSPRRSIEA